MNLSVILNRMYNSLFSKAETFEEKRRIRKYLKNGRVPWSVGYADFKKMELIRILNDERIIQSFIGKELPAGFGIGIDERIIEYPWILSRLSNNPSKILDAGSTFNFDIILDSKKIAQKELTICTFYPEEINYNKKRISYVYSDLRQLPFKDELFDEVVCQSTLEHIDMDNSIYGYDLKKLDTIADKSYEYLKAVKELIRVLKSGGTLLITFPFGKFENHGFFQQFDDEMLTRTEVLLQPFGTIETDFIQYINQGWQFAQRNEMHDVRSYNPHTGVGKTDDGAAHCRGICLIQFIKK